MKYILIILIISLIPLSLFAADNYGFDANPVIKTLHKRQYVEAKVYADDKGNLPKVNKCAELRLGVLLGMVGSTPPSRPWDIYELTKCPKGTKFPVGTEFRLQETEWSTTNYGK